MPGFHRRRNTPLRAELGWGGWPADDYTLEANRKDLRRHQGEFDRREAFAYTVLDPEGAKCLGCVYIEPWQGQAQLFWWVTDEWRGEGRERDVLEDTLTWLHREWGFQQVIVPLRDANPVGIALARSLVLQEVGVAEHPDHLCFRSIAAP